MRIAGTILGIACAAALAACAHHNAQSAGAQTGGAQAGGQVAAACPLTQIQGVHATVADIPNGVAITFTGSHEQVDQLRKNVHDMADANDKQGDAFAACPCAEGAGALGSAEAMPSETGSTAMQAGPTALPRADSKVDDIETGAILRLTAKDNTQVSALRSTVRQDVHALKRACLNEQGGRGGAYQQQQQQPYDR